LDRVHVSPSVRVITGNTNTIQFNSFITNHSLIHTDIKILSQDIYKKRKKKHTHTQILHRHRKSTTYR
jgi:hypothetical protein